jgi:hypothetical protein
MSFTSGVNYRGPLVNDVAEEEPEPEPVAPVQPVQPAQPGVPVQPVQPVVPVTPVEEEEDDEEVKPSFEETIAANVALAGLWRATPLLEFGPGVRATYDARGSDLSTTSIGPLLRARYQLSKRVNITAQVAAEFHSFDTPEPEPVAEPAPAPEPAPVVTTPVVTPPADPNNPNPTPAPVVVTPVVTPVVPEPEPDTPAVYDNGEDPFIAAELGMAWSPTEHWTLSLLAARRSRVSPNQNEDFQQVLSARAAVSRKFDYLVITAGAGYESESPMRQQIAGTPVTTNLDRDYLTADLSVSFPIWKDKAFATTFVRYRDQQTGDVNNTWDGYQAGIAVGVSF